MKATLPDGTVLEGTVEELSSALKLIQPPVTGGSANGAKNGNANATHGTAVWTLKRAQRFWDWLYGNQQKLVQLLLDQGGSGSIPEIMKHLGMKKGNELAGVRSCITRNARRETGYKEAEVIQWALGKDGKWYYKLSPEVHELLKQIAAK